MDRPRTPGIRLHRRRFVEAVRVRKIPKPNPRRRDRLASHAASRPSLGSLRLPEAWASSCRWQPTSLRLSACGPQLDSQRSGPPGSSWCSRYAATSRRSRPASCCCLQCLCCSGVFLTGRKAGARRCFAGSARITGNYSVIPLWKDC
jgi:hypothetical protein